MATLQQLESALRKADAAGNAEDARLLAAEIRKLRAPKTAEELTPGLSLDPTSNMSGPERFGAGVGQSLASTGRGLKQAAAQFGGPLGVMGPIANTLTGGQLFEATGQADVLRQLQAQETEARALETPLLQTPGGLGGSIVGYGLQTVGPGVALRGTTAGAAFLPATIRGSAAQGAALGAIQPLATGEDAGDAAANVGLGAVAGGAGTALVRGLGLAARGAARVPDLVRRVSPAATQAMQQRQAAAAIEQLASDPAAVRAAVSRPVQQIVPGSAPTLAEVTRDPGLAMAERSMRTMREYAPDFQARDVARNAARVEFIERTFGGASREAEQAARTAVQEAQGPAIREAIKQTGAETMRVIKGIDRVAKSPRFRNAPLVQQSLSTVRGMLATPLDDAARLSAARGVAQDFLNAPKRMSSADLDKVLEARRLIISAQRAGGASDEVLKEVKKLKPKSMTAQGAIADMSRSLRTAEKGKPDVASLYNARKYVTQTLMRSADPETMTALRGVVKSLDDEIDEVAPTYKQYLRDYAEGMRGANQIGVGARLLETGKATPGEFVEVRLTPGRFIQQTRDMDQFVQRATGFRRARAERTLTPEQLRAVDAVRRDLARFDEVQTARASRNSQTMENALGTASIQSMAGPVGAAMIEPVSGVALMFVNAARKQYGERVGQLIFEALENPTRAAEILAQVPPNQRSRIVQQVAPYLRQIEDAAARAAAAGGIAATRPEDEVMDIGTVSGGTYTGMD